MRCYNGAPDKALASLLTHRAAIRAEARRLGYYIAWHPGEERWQASTLVGTDQPVRSVGPLCNHMEQALAHIREDYAKHQPKKVSDQLTTDDEE